MSASPSVLDVPDRGIHDTDHVVYRAGDDLAELCSESVIVFDLDGKI